MATVPSHKPNADPSNSSNSAKAEYEAAVTAHEKRLAEITPARESYNELYAQHTRIKESIDKIGAQTNTQRSIYLRHRQYVVSLSNALLASNTALLSAPYSHLQVLTQATLIHKLRDASRTLVDMIVANKRLDEMRDASYRLDQESFKRGQSVFKEVEEDCREVDELHANVVDAEKKMGQEPKCGLVNGDCDSCLRNKEREAGRALAEKLLREAKERASREAQGGMGKAAKGKQRLDDILEEEDGEDGANA